MLCFRMLCFGLLSMVISTYILFLCHMFIVHLCFYVFTLVLFNAIEHVQQEKRYGNKIITVLLLAFSTSVYSFHLNIEKHIRRKKQTHKNMNKKNFVQEQKQSNNNNNSKTLQLKSVTAWNLHRHTATDTLVLQVVLFASQ